VLLLKLGYRNLWRNRRRTLLTMTAMAVATAMVILMLGVFGGMLWDMRDSATTSYYGHAKITAAGYLDQRKLHLTIPQEGVRDKLIGDPGVIGAAGRVRGFALLSFGEGESSHTQPAELFGIDPAEERTVTNLDTRVIEGSFVSGSDSHDMVIGKGLARRLETEIGGEIVVMGSGADGSIAADIFTVAGIIESGDPIRDSSLAVVGRQTLQSMLVLEGRLHEVAVLLKRPLTAREWVGSVRPQFPDYEVLSWFTFLPAMGQIFDLWAAIEWVFAIIFYFAVILVAVNTMYMAFFERIREFGIIGAIGLKKRNLAYMIIIEGLLMSSISGIIGGIVGSALVLYMSKHFIDLSMFFEPITFAGTVFLPRIRAYPSVENMISPVVMIVVLGGIVALFPARKLMKLRPVDALREV